MKEVIEDLIQTVKRLNNELDERTKFEQKLIEAISAKDEEISKLKESLAIYENSERIQELKEEIKAEQLIDKAVGTKPLVEPKDLTKDVVMD